MATEIPVAAPMEHRPAVRTTEEPLTNRIAWRILRFLSSLKLTVALFAMGIFIILVGTLAQVDKDMWEVIDFYFRSWITTIDFQVFFPRPWFPKWQDIPFGFWFPGGAAIGAAMVINLLAAHLVRFKTQATSTSLALGTAVIVVGAAITGYVIVSGHNREGLQGEPPFSWPTLWLIVKLSMAILSVTALGAAYRIRARKPERTFEWVLYGCGGLALALITLWAYIARDNAYLGDAGMRILWQLIQATLCGLLLLGGCHLVFRRRGGIVLIHLGVGLMMFGQFFVAKYDVEEQMRLEEGQTRAYGEDIRQTELAIVDSSDPKEDRVVAIPRSTLLASLNQRSPSIFTRLPKHVDASGIIHHPELPFDIQVVEYYKHAELTEVGEKGNDAGKNPATMGLGTRFQAVPLKPSSGASSEGNVDFAAMYVRLLRKDGSGEIGTYLVSQLAPILNLNEMVRVGEKAYDVSLRFRRNYKSYQITLLDVRKDDYVGTSTPKNYSSDVKLVDNSRGVNREIHIWMNNPLRYAGETFYQSGYAGPPQTQVETTTLSVVTNAGWMIPYVSCMIVIVGLASHFLGTLMRFLRRPDASEKLSAMSKLAGPSSIGVAMALLALLHKFGRRSRQGAAADVPKKGRGSKQANGEVFEPSLEFVTMGQTMAALMPLVVGLLFVFALLSTMWPHRSDSEKIDLAAFGQLPVIAEGRVKPFDTLARNTLRVISNKESFKDPDPKRPGKTVTLPAIRWLLDVMTQQSEDHRVMRIDHLEVLDTLGLKRREGHLYSLAEMIPRIEEFDRQVNQAQEESKKKGVENLTTYQKKLLELSRRIHTFRTVEVAFRPPAFPSLPTREDDSESAQKKLVEFRDAYWGFLRTVDAIQAPLAVPTKVTDSTTHQQTEEWQPYSKAFATAYIEVRALGNEPSPGLQRMNEILVAYSQGNAKKFNKAVEDYHQWLRRDRRAELIAPNTFWNRTMEGAFGSFYQFEAYFNRVSLFTFCWFAYVAAAVFAATSWLVGGRPLLRSAWWLAGLTFVVHTLALLARIYISGRPPVTNLYSSAVFIGWGIVLFCLVFESMYPKGLATFLGSLLGFASLVVAHSLAADGDTFTVLQAVLDTQFWLATHVVCITLGYATTFLAGGLGVAYILRGLFTPTLNRNTSSEMARMIYGTTCFALFFSFFGTVLGGLWADDSWGRFWGWDPKENGALIIVLWNALILHAHWDGMAKDRGLAVLAVFGNIVTSWSWFGVNQLQVGLHSYGFTAGVLLAWGLFSLSQLAVIAAGCIPKSLWWSYRRLAEAKH